MATGCKKNDFGGGETGNYIADCRQNEGYGDLYSWETVNRYQIVLCPNGWQVPTRDDFIALDKALGGDGTNNPSEPALLDAYLNDWGCTYGGYCNSVFGGSISQQGSIAHYWSKSEFGGSGLRSDYAVELELSAVNIRPQYVNDKSLGFMLRCVRDN
jgi:uncharacterized protein (TIGR02145 family)